MDQFDCTQFGRARLSRSAVWVLLLLDAICRLYRSIVNHHRTRHGGLRESHCSCLTHSALADFVDRVPALLGHWYSRQHSDLVYRHACCNLWSSSSGLYL